jgi:iron(III) transport system permease protein
MEVVCNTAAIAFGSVLASGLAGTGLAVLLTRYSFPGRGALAVLAYLPFTLPPLVGVLSFYYLIGLDGFIPRSLERITGTYGWSLEGPLAILLIHTYSFYVFFYAMVSSALESFDHSQAEAARTLGASRLRVFLQVTIPQLRPALLGASLLTFMSSGASFSAPLLFGHGFPVLSVRIYEQRTQFQDSRAFTLTVVLALLSLAAVFLFRSAGQTRGSASKGVRTPLRSAPGRVLAGAFSVACILVLLTPHLTIAWLSLVDHRQWFEELVPTTFTLANYTGLLQNSAHFTPIRNSLWMSALAALATLAVALPAGYLIGRRRPGSRLVNLLAMVPWALPGTVVAINLIVAFNDPWLPLYNTVWMLPFAYFVRGIPLLTRMTTAAVEPFDAGLIEAGRTLGASRFYCLTHLVLPLLAPAIAAATALVFALSLGEFVASILLYVQANIPISMQIFMQMRGSGMGSAFAYSMFLMLLVAGTFILARRFGSRAI